MLANWIIALATAVIAAYSVVIWWSAQRGAQETRDLYEAIVIATLLSGAESLGGLDNAIRQFKMAYKGKTQIFGGMWE